MAHKDKILRPATKNIKFPISQAIFHHHYSPKSLNTSGQLHQNYSFTD